MAKNSTKTEDTASPFKIEAGLTVPARVRPSGAATSYPFAAMAVGQSFLMPVVVPDAIKDAAERGKAFKEECRKLSNRVSGAIRRFRTTNADADFAVRTVDEDKMGHGVRVWRIAKEAPKTK